MKMTEEEMLERRKKQQELDRLDAIKKLKICIVVGILSLIVLIVSAAVLHNDPVTIVAGAAFALMVGVSVNLTSRIRQKPKQ